MSNVDCDILVVGAGLSGLTAAYRAQQFWPEDKILVLEANGEIFFNLYYHFGFMSWLM